MGDRAGSWTAGASRGDHEAESRCPHPNAKDPTLPSDPPREDLFQRRYRERRPALTRSLQRVADYIERHRVQVLAQSAVDIGEATGTSDSTVVRAVQALGFAGLPELRQALTAQLTGMSGPEDDLRQTIADVGADAEAAMRSVRTDVIAALEALGAPESFERLLQALRILQASERVAVFGIGPTAHLAAYLGTRLRRQGRARLVLSQTGRGLADDLLELKTGDALVMMAYGELYGEAHAIMQLAASLRVPIILISDGLSQSELAGAAAVVLPVTRGKNHHFSLHGATLTCLEMLLLGLAVASSSQALANLARLSELRAAIAPTGTRRSKSKI